MRKYDRNAVFNIVIKVILFALSFTGSFLLFTFPLKIRMLISALLSVIIALGVVFLFSILLRYTRFYYPYYSFVSKFIFRDKEGNVFCPCCSKYFDAFRDERFYADPKRFNPDMFSNARQDVICDFCRSAPRHRIIAEWAEDNISLLQSSKILYFAPELSMMLWFRKNRIRVKTADLYDPRTDLKLDITALDLPDGSEDIVFCNHILEHVSDYSKALSELHRVIRKGGRLIISFPIDPDTDIVREGNGCSVEERIRLFGQNDHLRVFGKNSGRLLEDAGFEVDVIDVNAMPENIMPVTGPADYDANVIFCCIRK
ncbi:MAG: methyltransferase domain-containing protein [Saccharofermentans sp.]|nr:methyltransferase domain-containing protein [Saccharofermentans sp.]